MKITKTQLGQIIREELDAVVEGRFDAVIQKTKGIQSKQLTRTFLKDQEWWPTFFRNASAYLNAGIQFYGEAAGPTEKADIAAIGEYIRALAPEIADNYEGVRKVAKNPLIAQEPALQEEEKDAAVASFRSAPAFTGRAKANKYLNPEWIGTYGERANAGNGRNKPLAGALMLFGMTLPEEKRMISMDVGLVTALINVLEAWIKTYGSTSWGPSFIDQEIEVFIKETFIPHLKGLTKTFIAGKWFKANTGSHWGD